MKKSTNLSSTVAQTPWINSGEIGFSQNSLKAHETVDFEQYRPFFLTENLPMYVFDANTLKFLEVNDAALHKYGYSKDEFLSFSLTDIRPIQDLLDLQLSVDKSKPIEALRRKTWRHIKKNGEIIEVLVKGYPVLYKGLEAKMVSVEEINYFSHIDQLLLDQQNHRHILDFIPEGIVIYDKELRMQFVNKSMQKRTGLTRLQMLGKTDLDLFPEEVTRVYFEELKHCATKKIEKVFECNLSVPSLGVRRYLMHYLPVLDSNDKLEQVFAVMQDITEQSKYNDLLRHWDKQYQNLVGSTYETVFLLDQNGKIKHMGPNFPKIINWPWSQAKDQLFADRVAPQDRERFEEVWQKVINQNLHVEQLEFEIIVDDERTKLVSGFFGNLLGESEVQSVIVNLRDVESQNTAQIKLAKADQIFKQIILDTTHKEVNGLALEVRNPQSRLALPAIESIKTENQNFYKLLREAYFDNLTALPNRNYLVDKIEDAFNHSDDLSSKHCAILLIDIDRFKIVNDSLGHSVGDQLLIAISERIKSILSEHDTVARLGGDEFAILIENNSDSQFLTDLANRIIQQLAKPFSLGTYEVYVTPSIGIAIQKGQYSSPESILRDADTAMYRAKAMGRGRYSIFDSQMHTTVLAQLELESDLRRAIERNEFVLHYQPIIDLNTNQICSCEALVRWNHPTRGLLGPNEFIPLAEETGLILSIDSLALSQACHQAKKWQEEGLPKIQMAVNLSVLNLKQNNLEKIVKTVLKQTQLSPEFLKLELTESLIMDNIELAVEVLNNLRDMGVQIAVDDFGTGYSSLTYLNRLAINTLKIDRSFIKDIPSDVGTSAITSTIISLAHNLNLQVVAEGVETEEQLQWLHQFKCDKVQGYIFSKALDPLSFANFIQKPLPKIPYIPG